MPGQGAFAPGGVQQVPADPSPRQHRHDLHDPRANAALVTAPGRVQGQQHSFRDSMRIRRPILSSQVLLDRNRPQPLQVSPVPQVLSGDHRRGLSQRQRQIPQLGRHCGGSLVIRQAGPPVQKRKRLLGAEHVHRDADPQARHRLPGADDQHPGRADGRNKRLQQVRIFRVVEHQQAAVPVGLQPVRTIRLTSAASRGKLPSDSPAASAIAARPASRLPVSAALTHATSRQPVSQLGPRIRRRQMGLACSPPPRQHAYRRPPITGPVKLPHQVRPGLETGWLLGDIAHH